MARYYIVIFIVNFLFAVFYYRKENYKRLSYKAFIFITGFSLFIAVIFPALISIFNLYAAIGINLIIASLGSYYIAQRETNKKDNVLDSPDFLPEDQEEERPVDEVAVSNQEEELPDSDDIDNPLPAEVHEEALSNPGEIQGEEIMSIGRLSVQDNADLLESYVSRGFDAKLADKLDLAIKYFSSALELNPPPDLEIMLVFDICAALRELGQYQKAREFLEQFLANRSFDLADSIVKEIKINMKHLELLQEMLAKANTPNLPYSKIPALIRVSVDEKINLWKNEAF